MSVCVWECFTYSSWQGKRKREREVVCCIYGASLGDGSSRAWPRFSLNQLLPSLLTHTHTHTILLSVSSRPALREHPERAKRSQTHQPRCDSASSSQYVEAKVWIFYFPSLVVLHLSTCLSLLSPRCHVLCVCFFKILFSASGAASVSLFHPLFSLHSDFIHFLAHVLKTMSENLFKKKKVYFLTPSLFDSTAVSFIHPSSHRRWCTIICVPLNTNLAKTNILKSSTTARHS